MALKALVDPFDQQIQNQEEVLASHIDTEGVAKAQGLAKFQEFWSTWIGEMEPIQESLAGLTARVNMWGIALQNLEVDGGPMREEIRQMDQVNEIDRATTTKRVTHL